MEKSSESSYDNKELPVQYQVDKSEECEPSNNTGLIFDQSGENRQQSIPEGTFEAPRFFLQKGTELGYHCHVYATIGKKDAGILLTVTNINNDYNVYAEPHRTGKVNRPIPIEDIGSSAALDISEGAVNEIGKFPIESRRQPSRNATLLATISK